MNPPNGERAAWIVALAGWFIGLFRYVFSAGAMVSRIEGVEKKVDCIAAEQTKLMQDVGVIKGELLHMNGRHK